MPSFVRYPDTCQFRNVVEQAERDHMTDAPLFFRGTAKADGTHADIVVKGDKTWLQSRNRVVTEADDNYHMAKWFSGKPIQELVMLALPNATTAGHGEGIGGLAASQSCGPPDTPDIIFSGEYCGRGLGNSNMAIAKLPNFFMIFSICVNGSWLDMAEHEHVRLPQHRIFTAREFGNFDTFINLDTETSEMKRLTGMVSHVASSCPIGQAFGHEGFGEGIVWVPPGVQNHRYRFKVKAESHSLTDQKALQRSQKKQAAISAAAQAEGLADFAAGMAGENRLRQGLDYLREMKQPLGKQSLGVFIKWVHADVVKEEGDVLEESGFDRKAVNKALNEHARLWFLANV